MPNEEKPSEENAKPNKKEKRVVSSRHDSIPTKSGSIQIQRVVDCNLLVHNIPSDPSSPWPEPSFGFQLPLHTSSVQGWGVQQRSSVLPWAEIDSQLGL